LTEKKADSRSSTRASRKPSTCVILTRRSRPRVAAGEAALLEHADELLAHRARGAHDAHLVSSSTRVEKRDGWGQISSPLA